MDLLNYFWICHRLPERSFHYHGKPLPVCARCTGIWLGYILGVVVLFFVNTSIWIALLLLVPAGIDVATQYVGWRMSNNYLRLVTGILVGIAEVAIVFYLIVFLFQAGYAFGSR